MERRTGEKLEEWSWRLSDSITPNYEQLNGGVD